jgi:hypothetical protein
MSRKAVRNDDTVVHTSTLSPRLPTRFNRPFHLLIT